MQDESFSSAPRHFSVEAEEAVIGSLLIDNEVWEIISEELSPADFYSNDCAQMYDAINKLANRDEPIDIVTLSDFLKQRAVADDAPDNDAILASLARLARATPSAANVQHYVRIVREYAIRRRLLQAANRIIREVSVNEGQLTGQALLDQAEQTVFELGDSVANAGDTFSMEKLGADVIKRTKEIQDSGSTLTGLATGYKMLDEKTGGIQDGDLLILAARPSMGKTALALSMAEHAALSCDRGPVVIFSMEMSKEQLAYRLCSSIGRINQLNLRKGQLRSEEWARLTNAVHILKNGKNEILIDDRPALRPDTIRAKVRRLKRRYKRLSLVIVDYLQLMQPTQTRENRTVDITAISQSLKALARETQVPVLALSQLNRNLEQRPNKRPIMSDLRESGALEQDADVILFIYRDEMYNEESPDKGTAEIIVGKQRNGPQFMTKLAFVGKYTRFEEYVEKQYAPEYTDGDIAEESPL